MKTRIIIATLLVLLTCSFYINWLQYEFVKQMEYQVVERDSIILKYNANDSLYNTRLKQYTDTIVKYISPTFQNNDGKSISVSEFLNIANNSLKKNDSLEYRLRFARDSIKAMKRFINEQSDNAYNLALSYQDTAFVFKGYVNLARKYGMSFSYTREKNEYIFKVNAEKLDSALILYPFFKDRLSYDEKEKTWVVKTKKGLFDR